MDQFRRDWQDIATAPKDGVEVLLAHDDGRIVIGYWSDEPSPDGTWFAQGGSDNIFPPPIAWMPLPMPPGGTPKPSRGT